MQNDLMSRLSGTQKGDSFKNTIDRKNSFESLTQSA